MNESLRRSFATLRLCVKNSEWHAKTPRCKTIKALVNAIYHRGYDQREPIEVRINPDGIEIVSYPDPDPSIRLEALTPSLWRRRNRNGKG